MSTLLILINYFYLYLEKGECELPQNVLFFYWKGTSFLKSCPLMGNNMLNELADETGRKFTLPGNSLTSLKKIIIKKKHSHTKTPMKELYLL